RTANSVRELEEDLALADHPELVAGDALDGRRVAAQAVHVALALLDLAAQPIVDALHLGQLALERAVARQPRLVEDAERDAHDRDDQEPEGEDPRDGPRDRGPRAALGGRAARSGIDGGGARHG